MDIENLIIECTAYDFKVMLEEKKPKSWLKSVSAFANGLGGSLFFGIDNDGIVKGLDDVQYVCEVISSKIRDYMDPLPEVEMIPHDMDGLRILQLKVNAGHYTPYYYVGDGQRIAFVRVGDESLPATAEQMVRLVLKGSNKTFDSLHTDYKAEDYSFTILANSFKDRTKQEWDKKYLLSFGLVTGARHLTNAGALFADDCPLWQSRLYCTRWDGKEKGDAINDAEFTGNVLMLLREAMNFVKSNTKKGWDNPNVFQICTLKNSDNETKKRQEVGRGMRLCVNQNGERQDEEVLGNGVFDTNILTVIASESYDQFAKKLQNEIAE